MQRNAIHASIIVAEYQFPFLREGGGWYLGQNVHSLFINNAFIVNSSLKQFLIFHGYIVETGLDKPLEP